MTVMDDAQGKFHMMARDMERELLQSQKLASIGQLAAGVAHEINNPTGFVSSNLKTLDDYQKDFKRLIHAYRDLKRALRDHTQSTGGGGGAEVPRGTEGAGSAGIDQRLAAIEDMEAEMDIDYLMEDISALIAESREGTERITRIVNDLKHFAHPGEDKVQNTDVNAGLISTLNIVNNELKYKANIIKEFGDLPIITANPQLLNQVFANILVNASQAIADKGEIRVQTRRVGDMVEICISDSGCGIPEEHLPKIFDPFFTTKEVGKGTGLGMNIVYNIIQKHHGTIHVKSSVGEGTQFIIQLPVDPDDRACGDTPLTHCR